MSVGHIVISTDITINRKSNTPKKVLGELPNLR